MMSGPLTAQGPDALTAWIEVRKEVAHLLVADGGSPFYERSLALADTLNWGYEGCAAVYLKWHGDRVVVATSENSFNGIFSIEPRTGAAGILALGRGWAIENSAIAWISDTYPDLLHVAALPSLDAWEPVPHRAPANARQLVLDRALPLRALRENVFEQLESVLFRPNDPAFPRRLIVASLGYPFHEGAYWRKQRRSSPFWITAYWHRYLQQSGRRTEAAELLALLERIADAENQASDLAECYVRRQAATLAEVCRRGALPPGWYCFLFEPAPGSTECGSRADATPFPPVLRQAFEELVRARPARLPETR